MALQKQILSLPVVGGLATDMGPLALKPGSFLELKDVRQERGGEWRNRNAIVRDSTLDDTAGLLPPLRVAPLPGGGLFGLSVAPVPGAPFTDPVSSGVIYSSDVPAGVARWRRQGTNVSAVTPGYWSRNQVATDARQIADTTIAVGNGLRLIAWKPGNGATGEDTIKAMITSLVDGSQVMAPMSIGPGLTGASPKAIYDSSSQLFLLFWIEGVNVKAARFSGTTGAYVAQATLKTNAGAIKYLDATRYSGSTTATVIYIQSATNLVRHLEVTPSTFALATDVDLAVDGGGAIAVMPDPDASGIRLIGASGVSTGGFRMLRVNAAGAIQSNSLVDAAGATQIAGCAYNAGADWMTVYRGLYTGQPAILASKRYLGADGVPAPLLGGYAGAAYSIDSNAWRQVNTDHMRYILGYHVGQDFAAAGDFQSSYFEMALKYHNGGTSVSNYFTEPQARLIPLAAGPNISLAGLGSNPRPQVVEVPETGAFEVTLPRIAQALFSAGTINNRYAVDVWSETVLSTAMYANFQHPNLGPGLLGATSGYLPAGLLLQSGIGAAIVGHGSSALPLQPTMALAVSATGLTAGQQYRYKVTDELPDDTGNPWRSGASIPSVSITPTPGNLGVTVTVRLPILENFARLRIVKLWRTLGDGSEYQLVYQTTVPCDFGNQVLTITDTTTDANLALSNFLPEDLPTTITPAFNHVANFDGRMWGAERDFPSRLRYTKKTQLGYQPEFPGEFVLDINDEYGDITGLAILDDKQIVFKERAIYFIADGGPADDGSGGSYTAVRVESTGGSVPGTPTISTGDRAWYYNQAGWHTIDRALQVVFIGSPIDKWFNQELVSTPEMPLSITYNRKANEVRILTTNYRFVYDLHHNCWIRDTGGPAGALYSVAVPGVGDAFIRPNGQTWWDYDDASTSNNTDASGTFQGVIRSPWFKPKVNGYMRFYAWRSTWLRVPASTEAAWPQARTYYDDDDTITETYLPPGVTNPTVQRIEQRPTRQRCTSFSLELTLPTGDIQWRVNEWSFLIGIAARDRFIEFAPALVGRQQSGPFDSADLMLRLETNASILYPTPPAFSATIPWPNRIAGGTAMDALQGPDLPMTVATDGVDGLPYVYGAGVGDPKRTLTQRSASTIWSPAVGTEFGPFHFFAAVRLFVTTAPQGYEVVLSTPGPGVIVQFIVPTAAAFNLVWQYGFDASSNVATVADQSALLINKWVLLEWRWTGSVFTFRINGTLVPLTSQNITGIYDGYAPPLYYVGNQPTITETTPIGFRGLLFYKAAISEAAAAVTRAYMLDTYPVT